MFGVILKIVRVFDYIRDMYFYVVVFYFVKYNEYVFDLYIYKIGNVMSFVYMWVNIGICILK